MELHSKNLKIGSKIQYKNVFGDWLDSEITKMTNSYCWFGRFNTYISKSSFENHFDLYKIIKL